MIILLFCLLYIYMLSMMQHDMYSILVCYSYIVSDVLFLHII